MPQAHPVVAADEAKVQSSRDAMTNPNRRWLVDAIRSDLIPAFESRDFLVVPFPTASDRELRLHHPFGRLRRVTPAGFDIAEIRLVGRAQPHFSVSFGAVPATGIRGLLGESISAEDVLVHWLSTVGSLYEDPKRQRGFAIRRWFWQAAPTDADYLALVRGVVPLLEEIEQFLRVQAVGPHVRVTTYDR